MSLSVLVFSSYVLPLGIDVVIGKRSVHIILTAVWNEFMFTIMFLLAFCHLMGCKIKWCLLLIFFMILSSTLRHGLKLSMVVIWCLVGIFFLKSKHDLFTFEGKIDLSDKWM